MRFFSMKPLLVAVLALAVGVSSCKKDEDPDDNTPGTPTDYAGFTNVAYGGQTARIMLIDTLMKLIKSTEAVGGRAVTKAQLEAIYDNTAQLYSNISSNKKLSDKVAGGDDPIIRQWFDTIATRSARFAGSAQAVTTADNVYLPQMIEKKLMGGVLYLQAVGYIFDKVPVADNNTVVDGEGTAMQHGWDEGFGYFGASRWYDKFTNEERSASISRKDVDGNGSIDDTKERNWYFARYAASRDLGYSVFTSAPTNYANEIFKYFVEGRHAIDKKDNGARDAAGMKILEIWDKVIAATAIKYADDCKINLANGTNINGKWAELYTFTEMLKHYSGSKLSGTMRAEIMAEIGNSPNGFTAAKADSIIGKLKTAFGF